MSRKGNRTRRTKGNRVLISIILCICFLLSFVDYKALFREKLTGEMGVITPIEVDSTEGEIGDAPKTEYGSYSGDPWLVVNSDIPDISDDKLTKESYIKLSEFDALGRCGVAEMCAGPETIATGERGSIGMVKPSGWKTVRYDDVIKDKYLYNRCHLLMWKLSGLNAEERNLITGTDYFNKQGMLPIEEDVTDYIYKTDNHVIYRVTPIYKGDNLVASGVLMEARSVEDDGLSICRYVYNVQPGIVIDYRTGESHRAA